ncbi:MAG TPA: FAD-binding protein [Thermoplasmata archaeon]|nr:FAD-binding protein [Thermoplasmata archaeon]
MEYAVLVKAVPDHEGLSFDPQRLQAVREGVELFLNPFDQRALRVALDLRRPGDRVSVASMGPPAAAGVLAEAVALGADRVSLVCDPALAGSDTLVTARVLTRLLGLWGSEVVLLGARTTDGETGQVPAEIAALRGVALATAARRVERVEPEGTFLVTSDTETGWARFRVPAPCVISVGEKAAKIVHPSESDRAGAVGRSVEIVTLRDLDIPHELVGAAGSPTRVASVRSEDPRRRGIVLLEGEVLERVAKTLALVALWGQERPRSQRVPESPLPAVRTGPARSIVLASGPDGGLEERALPMLTESLRALGVRPAAVWIGPAPAADSVDRMRRAGATELFHALSPPGRVDGRVAAQTFERILIGRPTFDAGFFLSSPFGREVAGRVAARLGLGLTGDAISVARTTDDAIAWSKPAFGGNAVAEVRSVTRPSLATVRPGVFEAGDAPAPPEWTVHRVDAPAVPPELQQIGEGAEPLEGFGDLDTARVALSLGTGVGGPAGVERVRSMVAGTGWAIAATRRVVDAGWVPRRLQVGLTGRSAAPELVVLLGVRGSANHLVGWRRAGTLIAINPDHEAPVFAGADVGIVADWETVLPELVERLRAPSEGPPPGANGPGP